MDIPQGNAVTEDAVAKLKPGMTRAQVRFVLGTPLLTDPFHANRWDYVYEVSKGGKLLERKHLTVYFDGDKMTRYEGEVLPAERAILPSGNANAPIAASAPTQEIKP
ncbi:outer membrane protein assembly factor BamE [Crenobacter sp. SG2303]|uniref:Outer membrane protein assembly factor BamE n=1 Tax=Crenobacter oryzisoli TaxID=3056844 RepID=A0ABT7XRC9_9NEIS|nr:MULTISPECIES: outer membrane protein assembly factor BamE [unclassified Crenobacter]MDN0076348.1 outer membrane protein assembly factor BamE [Crenobacter sp. SG2303]MDN0084866.1 outer membrane protein assembly factor BamE [Crenobacter sp. SG2305]